MQRLSGVVAAAATPLNADFTIDTARLVEHCAWLLDGGGCHGINLLGTTGEATSFSVEQRLAAMTAIARSGLPLERFMVGTGAAALADAVGLTAAAMELGFAGALLLPPFYYKGIDDDGLESYVQNVIDRVGGALRLYLYHFPQNSGVPYPIEVVERLHARNGGRLLGVKDSSGDLGYSAELARRLPGFDVFPSSEGTLAKAAEHGFAGCISATVNVTGALARTGWEQRGTAAGEDATRQALAIREALARFPLIAGIKAALADFTGRPEWHRLCPPLRPLAASQWQALSEALAGTAYRTVRRPAR